MLFQTKKSLLIAFSSLVFLGTSLAGSVQAQEYRYPPANALEEAPVKKAPAAPATQRPMPGSYPMPYPAQNFPPPAGFGPAPGYGGPVNRPMPYGPAPYGPTPYGPSPYGPAPVAGSGPMGPGPGVPPPYGNPYNRGPFGGGPFGGSPFGGGGPFKNFGFGPFNGKDAPWETWPFGGRDSFWSRKEFPFDNQNPSDWFQPDDPKEGLAIMWDDLISAPDDMGTMPGGWYVPSVSVPNPVDLEDQMEKATKEVPDLIRIYN